MISCGAQCLICDYPIHFDTFRGCIHDCKYCYVRQKYSIGDIEPIVSVKELRNFIDGKRKTDTKWCDWPIPLHWGANSDPFQEVEKQHGASLECLKVFSETQYPFIVSTKNPVLLTEEPYKSLIESCRCVLQVSLACSKYDELEPGAPKYEERLAAAKTLNVTRKIARIQPFFPNCYVDILKEIPRYTGFYGVIAEGYTTFKKTKGMQKDGKKYDFSLDILVPMYKRIKEVCHENGLRFFCGEDRVRWLGDDLTCCGTEGLDGFKPNTFNIEHLAHGGVELTEQMKQPCDQPYKCIQQSQKWALEIKGKAFDELMHQVGDRFVTWYQEMREQYDV